MNLHMTERIDRHKSNVQTQIKTEKKEKKMRKQTDRLRIALRSNSRHVSGWNGSGTQPLTKIMTVQLTKFS